MYKIMSATERELHKIAALACIQLDVKNTQQLTHDVSAMMNFVEKLRGVSTQGIQPLLHPLDLHQRLRTDAITEMNQVHELANIAPQFVDDVYLVPKVIEIGK